MASEVTKRLRDRRQNAWHELKELAETAAAENRAFTAEEQSKWDVGNEELDNLDKRIKSALDAEKRAKDADDAFNEITRKPAEKRGSDGSYAASDGRDVNGELRAFLRGDRGAPKFMEIGHNPDLGPVNYRTLQSNTGSPTSIVPTDFYDRLISHLIEVSGIMQAGPTVLNTAGGESLQIPKTTAHSTAALTGQGTTLPTSDPAFAMTTLSAYKYGILLQVARELIDDTGVNALAAA